MKKILFSAALLACGLFASAQLYIYKDGQLRFSMDETPDSVVFHAPAVQEPVEEPKVPYNYDANLQYHAAPNEYLNGCQQAGRVITEYYNGIRGNKTLKVYVPYGYDENKKYNILYLMHGGSENENTIFGNDVNLQK